MKKLFIIFILFLSFAGLHAKWLYADFGIGSDITKISFHDILGDREGTENLSEQSDIYYTLPNYNFSIGVRINKRFIIIADIQSIKIDKYYNYQAEIGPRPYKYDFNLHIKSVAFNGLGTIFYPIERVQVRGSMYIGRPGYREEYTSDGDEYSKEGIGFGFGVGLSLAYDLPIEKFGILVGCRYINANVGNIIVFNPTQVKYNVSSFGLYVKIRY